jgi:HD superfamily phosphohydrolase
MRGNFDADAITGTRLPAWMLPPLEPEAVWRDPVHGNLSFSTIEMSLIGAQAFQRLARVHQLLAYMHFPQANHTRFAHALGVYSLARKVVASLWQRGYLRGVPKSLVKAFLIASMYHDLGHGPFSHTCAVLLEKLASHESEGRRLVEEGEIANIIEQKFGLQPSWVGEFIDPSPSGNSSMAKLPGYTLLRSVLDGWGDVDKGDYVPRDALATGYSANVPYEELIPNLAVYRGSLVLRSDGIHVVKSLLEARDRLYGQVYWQPTVRSFGCMLSRAVQEALIANALSPSVFQRLDDSSLLDVLQGSNMPPGSRELVWAFRQHAYVALLNIGSAHPFMDLLRALGRDSQRRRRVEMNLADELRGHCDLEIKDHEVLIDPPLQMGQDAPPSIYRAKPPLGEKKLSTWKEATGEDPDAPRWPERLQGARVLCAPHLYPELQHLRQKVWEALARALS